MAAWVCECLMPPLMASRSRFLPPVALCSKVLLGRSCSSCKDVSQQGLQAPPVGELATGNPVACSGMGRPCKHPMGNIAHCQIWQLISRLEHGRVESINQLAWYHTQFDTPMDWCHQFCSSETRLDQYVVYPKQLAFRFGKPKKQSCSVEYFSCSHCSEPHTLVSHPSHI